MPVRRLPTDYWRLLQIASRPVSRVLYGRKPCGCRRDGHSSGTPVAGRLEQPTRATGLRTGPARLAARASLLFGFAPGGACLAADVAADAVRSCRTLSPLPAKGRRFAFCGAFPEIALAGRYTAPCPHGARTFLRPKATAVRPAGGRHYGADGLRVKRCDSLARIEPYQFATQASVVGEGRDGRRNVLLDVLPDSGRSLERPLFFQALQTLTIAPRGEAPPAAGEDERDAPRSAGRWAKLRGSETDSAKPTTSAAPARPEPAQKAGEGRSRSASIAKAARHGGCARLARRGDSPAVHDTRRNIMLSRAGAGPAGRRRESRGPMSLASARGRRVTQRRPTR